MAIRSAAPRNEGILKLAPGSRMSGKARQAVAADLRGIWVASGPGQVVIEGERTREGAIQRALMTQGKLDLRLNRRSF